MFLNSLGHKVKKKKIRVGRGIGTGKGKTCGRGYKGQKSRSGVAIKSFEGGQMPLYRSLPKRGFNSNRKDDLAIVNLDQLQNYLSKNILNIKNTVNLSEFKKSKILKSKINKIKLLGKGELRDKINIEVNFVSKSAREKIEKNGGSIKLITK